MDFPLAVTGLAHLAHHLALRCPAVFSLRHPYRHNPGRSRHRAQPPPTPRRDNRDRSRWRRQVRVFLGPARPGICMQRAMRRPATFPTCLGALRIATLRQLCNCPFPVFAADPVLPRNAAMPKRAFDSRKLSRHDVSAGNAIR